jgi:adenylate kinase family enzyme
MRPVIPPRFVSLIGLPGSGKTTLCRSLAEALGWHAFIIGDALRAEAGSDPGLQRMLDRGELAPENLAVELMKDAARATAGQGLVIDGFPRHHDQVKLAKDLFDPWTILFLAVPAWVASSRLRDRLYCPSCTWVGSATADPFPPNCPQCGKPGLRPRPEDKPEVLSRRIKEAEVRLNHLLSNLGNSVFRLDATKSRDEILEIAIAALDASSGRS